MHETTLIQPRTRSFSLLQKIHHLGSPQRFYTMSGHWLAPLWAMAILALVVGFIWGLFIAPVDYQQGDAFRIIYLHVPAAMAGMAVYSMVAVLSFCYLVWRFKVAESLALAAAPIGLIFTMIALVTGSLWGKPMWGTWWVWDARLTSELFLLFLYIGYISLYQAIENKSKAFLLCSYLALVGFVDVPIIHYSVEWWQSLHQGSTLSVFKKPQMAPSMLYPLLLSLLGTFLFVAAAVLTRSRQILIWRERFSGWVKNAI